MATEFGEHSGVGIALGVEKHRPPFAPLPARLPPSSRILIAVAAVFGLTRIKVDDSLSQLFRSDTAEFKQYEEVTRRFPSAEFDVLVVVEGDVLDRDSLEALRNLDHRPSADRRHHRASSRCSRPASRRRPAACPSRSSRRNCPTDDAEYKALADRALNNEIIRGKLLSEDGTLALVVLALDPAVVDGKGLGDVVGEIRADRR